MIDSPITGTIISFTSPVLLTAGALAAGALAAGFLAAGAAAGSFLVGLLVAPAFPAVSIFATIAPISKSSPSPAT